MCDGGVVIDLSGMKRVEVDAGKRVARAEAGALVRDLDEATQVPEPESFRNQKGETYFLS
jgi:FAD/FMN-containing dehydrogenase